MSEPASELAAPRGSAGGMCLAERAHRESYQWDAFSLSDDPGVRAHLRRGYREGFMRGFNACAEMAPEVESLAGSAISWEPHPTDLGRLRGFLPAMPSVTLFLIDVCQDKSHRGTMRGAFIPDDEDGRDLNERALVVTLKHRAEAYLREWDEARAKQSPNATASATPNPEDSHGT